jgi:hypothetical protein
MCHESARKEKNGRGRNGDESLGDESLGDESLGRDRDILWKTFPMSSEQAYDAPLIAKSPEKYRLSGLFTVKPSCRHDGAAMTDDEEQAPACDRQNKMAKNIRQKRKTRPGGQPDGSSYMGAGVDGRSRRIQPRWGGITAPTSIGRGGLVKRSKRRRLFLTPGQASSDATYRAAD